MTFAKNIRRQVTSAELAVTPYKRCINCVGNTGIMARGELLCSRASERKALLVTARQAHECDGDAPAFLPLSSPHPEFARLYAAKAAKAAADQQLAA